MEHHHPTDRCCSGDDDDDPLSSSSVVVNLSTSAASRKNRRTGPRLAVGGGGSRNSRSSVRTTMLLLSPSSFGGGGGSESGSDSSSSSYLTREDPRGKEMLASRHRQQQQQQSDVPEGPQPRTKTRRSRQGVVVGRRGGGRVAVGLRHSSPPPRLVLLFLVVVEVLVAMRGTGSGSGGDYLCLAFSFVGQYGTIGSRSGGSSIPLITTAGRSSLTSSSSTLSLMNRAGGSSSSSGGDEGRSRVQRHFYRRRENATDELLASSPVVATTSSSSSVAVSTTTTASTSTTTTVIPPLPTAGAEIDEGEAVATGRRRSTTARRGRRSGRGSYSYRTDADSVRERLELQYRQLLVSSTTSTTTTIAVGGQPQHRGSASAPAAAEVVAAAVAASLARAVATESTSSSRRQWSIASPTAAARQTPRRPRGGAPVLVDEVASSGCVDVTLLPTVIDKKEDTDSAAVTRARYLLLVAAALYGTNFSCVKLLLMGQDHALPVGASSTVRFGMAALATAPWLFPHSLKECKLGSSSVAAIIAGLEVGAWNSIGYVAQAIGLETTEASKSAFLCSLAVVVVPILDYLFKNKKMQAKQVVGTTMALVGVAILELGGMLSGGTGGDAASGSASPLLSSGDLASLIQPLAFGMGFWRMEAAMHKYPHQALRSTAAQLFAVFVGSAAYCYGVESAGLTQPTLTLDVVQEWFHEPTILAGLLWTGVVTTALTVYMETMALETLSAAETTLIFSTEPLWGTACAAAVMGEQLGIDAGIGAVLIVVGCLFSNLGWKGVQEHFSFPRMSLGTSPSDSARGSDSSKFAGSSTLAGGAAATLASVWNNLSVAAKVLAIQAEDLLQDLGFLAER